MNAPAQISYAEPFVIETTDATDIASVALLGLSAVTHSVNMGQRYVGLDYVQTGAEQLTISAPQDGNHAPPGYYMLFILNGEGVPSVATMVRVIAFTKAIPTVSEWGLLATVLLLVGVGGTIIARREPASWRVIRRWFR